MALQPCPECAAAISTSAHTCPQCGHPLRQVQREGCLPLLALLVLAWALWYWLW